MAPTKLTRELVRRAVIGRQEEAVRCVVQALTPIVHARVSRVLLRRGGAARRRDIRQDVQDLVQDVFVALLADGGRRLLAWRPERGTASAFFGVVTERLVLNTLTSRRRNPWTEAPTEPGHIDARGSSADPERLLVTRGRLRVIGARLVAELSERDQRLFELLYVRRLDDEAVREALGIRRDALYQARRRLRRRVQKIGAEVAEQEREEQRLQKEIRPVRKR